MSVKRMVKACKRCPLVHSCSAPVPIDGPTPCNLLVIGEAPGAEEDKKGVPFIGHAGSYIRGVLGAVGINVHREVAWCNVVSCRPPSNRTPLPDEIADCKVNLEAQIALANPRVILLAGGVALQAFRPDMNKITQYRGTMLWLRPGQVAIATYHPAAVLRKKRWGGEFEEDCKLAKRWVRGETREWPDECFCGLKVEVYDWMGVPYCKHHKHLQYRDRERPVQERLAI